MHKQQPIAYIDIHDPAARSYWAAQFGITEERLRRAVRQFGSRASTVRACLGLPPA